MSRGPDSSSPVSWHQPRRAVAMPGMHNHRDILVIRSSFLMRLLSHNPLSTPFDPPFLLRRIFDLGGEERRLGDTPHPEASLRPNPGPPQADHSRGSGNPEAGLIAPKRAPTDTLGSIAHRLRVITCVNVWIPWRRISGTWRRVLDCAASTGVMVSSG